ncbi:hypothetical protein BGZ94_008027 [Podila epigama]|nr:hypothetical protein BGZ94_008027 [Podila epigama]
MDRIDKSLDEIIKGQRGDKKKAKPTAHNPKKTAVGIQSNSALRAKKEARAAKSNSPYARPHQRKEEALFTASFKAQEAPVKEIFTAGYVPKPKGSIKLYTTNNKPATRPSNNEPMGPISTKSLRLVTTQTPKTEPIKSLTSASASRNSAQARSQAQSQQQQQRQQQQQQTQQRPEARGTLNDNRRNDRQDNYRRDSYDDRFNGHSNNRGNERQESNRNNSYDRRDSASNSRVNDRHGSDYVNRNNTYDNRSNGASTNRLNSTSGGHNNTSTHRQEAVTRAQPPSTSSVPSTADQAMDIDTPISIRGVAPGDSVAFRGESGPVTIEIENLDPGTTADDVKYVCSRFGEIRSCMCANGYAQVTYARKAAGLAAVENLHGKKADNGQILRVAMRPNPIIHTTPTAPTVVHTPSALSGPMKILEKAVHGTITNAGTLYADQLLAAQTMIKVQQHKMAYIQQEEQRINMMRQHVNPTLQDPTRHYIG